MDCPPHRNRDVTSAIGDAFVVNDAPVDGFREFLAAA
jgi:hypothetical protein